MANKINSLSQKILVVEYYLTHKTNGIKSIAKELEIMQTSLLKIVNQYEKDGFLILPSKMN